MGSLVVERDECMRWWINGCIGSVACMHAEWDGGIGWMQVRIRKWMNGCTVACMWNGIDGWEGMDASMHVLIHACICWMHGWDGNNWGRSSNEMYVRIKGCRNGINESTVFFSWTKSWLIIPSRFSACSESEVSQSGHTNVAYLRESEQATYRRKSSPRVHPSPHVQDSACQTDPYYLDPLGPNVGIQTDPGSPHNWACVLKPPFVITHVICYQDNALLSMHRFTSEMHSVEASRFRFQ